MITILKNRLLMDWHTTRWVALGLGTILGLNWLFNSAPISGFLALFFLYQAVTNTGCLAGQCVPVSMDEERQSGSKEIDYKEIK